MKMGQKGLGTGAIIGIVVTVVVVVVVVAVAAVLLMGGGQVGLGTVPVYAGAAKSSTAGAIGTPSQFLNAGVGRENSGTISDVPAACEEELYTAPTGTSVTEILNWYKTQMQAQGWYLLYEESYSYSDPDWGISASWGLLYFEKGDRTAAVVAAAYDSYTYFALVEGPETTFDYWMDSAGYEWEEPEIPGGGGIGTATSLSFNVDGTYAGQSLTSTVKMKNIGQPTAKLRMDMTMLGMETKIIVDAGANKLWMWTADTGWQDMSGYISPETYTSMTQGYTTQLSGWTGGDYTYTDPTTGTTVRIYNIVVNPDLPDSLFQAV